MDAQTVRLGFAVTIILIYFIWFIWTKFIRPKTKSSDTARPPNVPLPKEEIQNDKLVIVNNITKTEIDRILTGFCNSYNKKSYQVQPRLYQISEKQFAITFPYDVEFTIFCFFINYVHYPTGFHQSFDVTGWTTTKSGQTWITEKSSNKHVMLFIPAEDTEYDNVYLTTDDNIGYKLGFARGEEKQLLNFPQKRYIKPNIDIAELKNRAYKDYK